MALGYPSRSPNGLRAERHVDSASRTSSPFVVRPRGSELVCSDNVVFVHIGLRNSIASLLLPVASSSEIEQGAMISAQIWVFESIIHSYHALLYDVFIAEEILETDAETMVDLHLWEQKFAEERVHSSSGRGSEFDMAQFTDEISQRHGEVR